MIAVTGQTIGLLVLAAMDSKTRDVESVLGDFRRCLNTYDAWAESFFSFCQPLARVLGLQRGNLGGVRVGLQRREVGTRLLQVRVRLGGTGSSATLMASWAGIINCLRIIRVVL